MRIIQAMIRSSYKKVQFWDLVNCEKLIPNVLIIDFLNLIIVY